MSAGAEETPWSCRCYFMNPSEATERAPASRHLSLFQGRLSVNTTELFIMKDTEAAQYIAHLVSILGI
ncbi:uncharacterized [Tachysurus ichikawai]